MSSSQIQKLVAWDTFSGCDFNHLSSKNIISNSLIRLSVLS